MATVDEQETQQQQQQPAPASSSGLDPKLGALLSYLLGVIGGVIFLVIEKDNKYVRFHAAQSIVFNIAAIAIGIVWTILAGIVAALPGVGFLGSILFLVLPLYWLAVFVVAIVLLIKAWTGYDAGETFKLPGLSGIAEKIAG